VSPVSLLVEIQLPAVMALTNTGFNNSIFNIQVLVMKPENMATQ
jgi:hypothetical protein